MQKRYFISYGDRNYQTSLNRIGQEAEALGYFDIIRLYSDQMLPEPFRQYTLQYPRGGGYWMWKPWVISQTLRDAKEGDLIVYADAGCTLLPHADWEYYFNQATQKEAVFFMAEGKNKKWCKQEVFHFFTPKNQLWKQACQIQATFMIVRKCRHNDVIERWCQLAMQHPELFVDVPEDKRKNEAVGFREHRHDQSVLTACICTAPRLSRFCILPEKMERRLPNGQALLASRISATGIRGAQATTQARQSALQAAFHYQIRRIQIGYSLLLYRLTRILNR